MTQTKIERLRNEMIAEHGDVTLLKCINRETHAVMSTVTLSKASIKNTADMKEVQKIVKSGKPREVYVYPLHYSRPPMGGGL